MDSDAELVDSEKQVAPVAGAAVKVVFRTRPGKALLIKSRMADGSELPMGADVLDENNTVVGIAGQGGKFTSAQNRQKAICQFAGVKALTIAANCPLISAGRTAIALSSA